MPPSILIEQDSANFRIPEDLERLTLSIVSNAGEIEGLEIVQFAIAVHSTIFSRASQAGRHPF